MGKSNKNKIVALVLCILLGTLGVHRFYAGKIKTGVLYLLTFGLFGFGWIYDIFDIVCNRFQDSTGAYIMLEPVSPTPTYKKWQYWVAAVLFFIFLAVPFKGSNTNRVETNDTPIPTSSNSNSRESTSDVNSEISTNTESDTAIESKVEGSSKVESLSNLEDNNKSESLSNTSSMSNNDFIETYQYGIVASAKLTLDKYISNYEISLAPQNWTIAKFDETDTVIAMTDVTYNNVVGQYIFVGTLDIENGDIKSATPHYISVHNTILANDGYCDDVFSMISNIS